MRRVLSKQLVSERLVNEHARTSTRGVGEDGRKKDWKSGSDGDTAPTHATSASAYAAGCLDDSDGSMYASLWSVSASAP